MQIQRTSVQALIRVATRSRARKVLGDASQKMILFRSVQTTHQIAAITAEHPRVRLGRDKTSNIDSEVPNKDTIAKEVVAGFW